jgi:hypothetical protein
LRRSKVEIIKIYFVKEFITEVMNEIYGRVVIVSNKQSSKSDPSSLVLEIELNIKIQRYLSYGKR